MIREYNIMNILSTLYFNKHLKMYLDHDGPRILWEHYLRIIRIRLFKTKRKSTKKT